MMQSEKKQHKHTHYLTCKNCRQAVCAAAAADVVLLPTIDQARHCNGELSHLTTFSTTHFTLNMIFQMYINNNARKKYLFCLLKRCAKRRLLCVCVWYALLTAMLILIFNDTFYTSTLKFCRRHRATTDDFS